MKLEDYNRIEGLLARAEAIFIDCPPVSINGKKIHVELSNLLVKVVVERHRHSELDRVEAERGKPNGDHGAPESPPR